MDCFGGEMNILIIYTGGNIFCNIYNKLKLLSFIDYRKYIHNAPIKIKNIYIS
jgi:hypothetical protein